MKIFPIIVSAFIFLVVGLPLASSIFGWGIGSIPIASVSSQNKCNTGQKDKYGRCPYSGTSSFRSFSISNGSGGGGGFGGSK